MIPHLLRPIVFKRKDVGGGGQGRCSSGDKAGHLFDAIGWVLMNRCLSANGGKPFRFEKYRTFPRRSIIMYPIQHLGKSRKTFSLFPCLSEHSAVFRYRRKLSVMRSNYLVCERIAITRQRSSRLPSTQNPPSEHVVPNRRSSST